MEHARIRDYIWFRVRLTSTKLTDIRLTTHGKLPILDGWRNCGQERQDVENSLRNRTCILVVCNRGL